MLNSKEKGPGVERGGEATGGRWVSVAGTSADTHGMAMPLLSYVGVAGVFWPGRCGPPFDPWCIRACSGDQGDAVWQGC